MVVSCTLRYNVEMCVNCVGLGTPLPQLAAILGAPPSGRLLALLLILVWCPPRGHHHRAASPHLASVISHPSTSPASMMRLDLGVVPMVTVAGTTKRKASTRRVPSRFLQTTAKVKDATASVQGNSNTSCVYLSTNMICQHISSQGSRARD